MYKLAVFLVLFTTTLFSNQLQESFSFVGITGTQNQIDFTKESAFDDQKKILAGIRYGEQTVDWRTMFTLSGRKEMYKFSLEVDKILMDDILGYPEIRPYIGATLGLAHYKNDTIKEEDGYYYGGVFGFLIYLTDNIDLDISYRYEKVKDIDTLNTLKGPSVGIHYFY